MRKKVLSNPYSPIGAAILAGLLLILTATAAFAFTQSNFISFTLEGCRNDGTITLPNGSGQFICPDAAYTTGNLGKGWNELDLVPHRLTTSAGNQGGVTTNYDVYIAADYQTSGHLGYDVISAPVVNAAKSDASCSVSAGAQSTQGSAGSPFGGGTDIVIYRDLTIHQNAGTTCVFDYYQRLALGAHLYPGSSLQSYLFDQAGLSGSKKTISIPVNQIAPQSISKDMTATQGSDHVWDITKTPSPATLTFANTCNLNNATTQGVTITVSWTKEAAVASGPITVLTHVYATNPAARVITTNVTDVIYSGTTQLDSVSSGPVNVPANTTNYLLLTHTFLAPSGTASLNDIATATYTDLVTGIPVPGTTTATASAQVQLSGAELDTSAVINDSESMTGAGLTFSADSFTPAIGSFDNGYIAGTQTIGPVSWTSSSQSGSGSVSFSKTVAVTQKTITSGTLSDTATLTGSSGFSNSASASVAVSADARVSLTINKTVANKPSSGSQTFTFHVKNSSNVEVAAPQITFDFTQSTTSGSVTVSDLAPDTYSVTEDAVTGWVTDSGHSANITLPACSGSVNFSNTFIASPAIVTSASAGGTVGAVTLNDTATLSGGFNPTGSILFTLTAPDNTTAYTQTIPVNGNGTYSTSPGALATQVGTYTWSAKYSGDTFNNGAIDNGANETAVIVKASPSLVTTASPNTGTVGTPITSVGDTATLSGGYNLTGTVTFTLYSDSSCTVSTGISGSGTISGGTASYSTSWTPTAPGTYYWQATYNGDANNNSFTEKCGSAGEMIVIGKASPAIVTNASAGGVVGLVTLTDSATLSGGDSPTGTITFTLTGPGSTTVDTETVTVNGDGTYTTPTGYLATAAGTYTWSASYSGDTNNNGAKDNGANESVVVSPASPKISTTAADASGASTSVSDSATLSGGYNPTGSITFKLYGPSATASCTTAIFSTSVTVSGNGTYGPVSFSPTAVGTYYWIASYSGDGNNAAVAGSCGDTGETSVVKPGAAQVIKTVNGAVPSGTQAFTFQLRSGASVSSDGTTLEQVDASSTNNWTINFTTQLVPGNHYQVCEWVLPGWNTSLGPNLFVPNSIIPPSLPNPNVNNVTVCTDFVASAGVTTVFKVDNTPPPGGRALTIGFWKNWASCNTSNGKQKPVLDQTLAVATGITSNPPGGLVVSAQNPGGGWPNFAALYYLVLKGDPSNPNVAPSCAAAVNLLNKSTITKGTKMASDPLFNMAAQLVGAQLNYFAGAGKNGSTTLNIQSGVLLLGKYLFNGDTYSPKLTSADATRANCLATQLNNYNNDLPATTCP